jgi:hypothetical protein
MSNITIKFDPPTYLGWKLSYYENETDSFRAFSGDGRGEKADTISELQAKIRKAEERVLFYDPPIKAMLRANDSQPWCPVEFYAISGDQAFYRDAKGEEHGLFITNMKNGFGGKFRLVTPDYEKLAAKEAAAVKANQASYRKVMRIREQFPSVTADTLFSRPTANRPPAAGGAA